MGDGVVFASFPCRRQGSGTILNLGEDWQFSAVVELQQKLNLWIFAQKKRRKNDFKFRGIL